ncbi:MAG: hypothetical protein J2P13_08730 [Acidobacteria bacterium]|nr:hypothetical protein [Acidobacteriota bacterium]
MHAAIYNSPNPGMNFPSSRLRRALCLCLFLSRLGFAADWRQPVSELRDRIAAITGPGVVALQLVNRSSISSADAEEIRRELTSALSTSGVRVWQPDQAAATVQLTLSENLDEYVWVAEVRQAANDRNVLVISLPRPDYAVSTENLPPITIRRTLLVSEPEPILDVVVLEGAPRRALVLGRNSLSIEELENGRGRVIESLPVSSPNPVPRDARGRIFLRKDRLFDVYLPGLLCRGTSSAPLGMNCSPSDDPWPLGPENSGVAAFFSPARNFFTGALAPAIGRQRSAPPFYSAAAIPRTNYLLWIFAGLDGQVFLLDGFNQQFLGKVRWGSNVASVHAACRPDWQVLADSAETEAGDAIQAFEFSDREPAPVSAKLNLNGSVTALRGGPPESAGLVIYRNSSTGNYEALELNLDCTR